MNNIRIGQYVPVNSMIHRLNPKVKIISLVLIIIALFIIPVSNDNVTLIVMGGAFVFSLFLVILSRVPIKTVLNNLKGIMLLIIFTFFIQIMYISGGELYYNPEMHISVSSILTMIGIVIIYTFTKKYIRFKTTYFLVMFILAFVAQYYLPFGLGFSYNLNIYENAVKQIVFIVVRLFTVVIFTSLLTYTTSTTELNDGLESVLKPLKLIKVPVSVIAMMISLTLRSIPTLLEETQKITKAQASRGVDFKESNLKNKIKQVISLLVPIFVISFKRSFDLSDAMETRCYVIGEKRSKYTLYKWNVKDTVCLIIGLVLLTLAILYRVL